MEITQYSKQREFSQMSKKCFHWAFQMGIFCMILCEIRQWTYIIWWTSYFQMYCIKIPTKFSLKKSWGEVTYPFNLVFGSFIKLLLFLAKAIWLNFPVFVLYLSCKFLFYGRTLKVHFNSSFPSFKIHLFL